MNEHFRLPVAILISLLLHVALLLWLMQMVQVRAPEAQGLLQVFLQKNLRERDRPLQLPVGTSAPALKIPQPKPAQIPAEIPKLLKSVAGGRFRMKPPSAAQQDELTNAMHLAQLAQQRESQRAAVLTGMSGLAARLGPIIKTRIVCTQQPDHEIDCTPAPEKNLRPLLEEFFNLAIEARRLGAAANPVRMDFGAELGVSVTLLR
ncbi:MAG: hypothetical protein Q7U91_09775 [Sideroxyarcus sp.]|nr:hypothetical protein [Sideroxyarcus sp.]